VAYATPADVEIRLGRPLEPDEAQIVETRLNDAERLIRSRIPDLDERVTEGIIDRDTLVMIEADAVLRLVRNPEGYVEEQDGDYRYRLSEKVASGELDILAKEWALLGVRDGVFVIRPCLEIPQRHSPPWWWDWR